MWGHYTNNYKGYCIKLKNDTLLKNEYVQIKSYVAYLKNYNPTNENFDKVISALRNGTELDKEGKKLYGILLTILYDYCWKYYDWQYEQEFRAISWTTNKFNRKLKYKESDLEEIYIGHRMKTENPKFYKSLNEVLDRKYKHVKKYEVKPHHLVVKLDFEEI